MALRARQGALRFLRQPIVWLVVLIASLLNEASRRNSARFRFRDKGWVFDQLPQVLHDWLTTPWIVAALLATQLAKAAVDVAASESMFEAFRGSSVTGVTVLRRAVSSTTIWLLLVLVGLYAAVVALALPIYFAAYALWRIDHVDITIAVLALAALMYPLYYALAAMASLLAVFPWSSKKRLTELSRVVTTRRSIQRLYLLYGLRLFAELALLTVGLLAATLVFRSALAATVAAVVALTVPLVVLRGASYGASLEILHDREAVDDLFERVRSP